MSALEAMMIIGICTLFAISVSAFAVYASKRS